MHYWGEDTFTNSDFNGLLTTSAILKSVTNSMDTALRSARKYKVTEQDFEGLRTELLLGVWCPQNGHSLWKLKMDAVEVEEILSPVVQVTSIESDEVATIGLSGFEDDAKEALKKALHSRVSVSDSMRSELEACIDRTRALCKPVIDKPTYGLLLNKGKVSNF